jgi:riboflavin kinase/FMN adenylyltransferase
MRRSATVARARLRSLLRAHRRPALVTIGTFDGVHAGHRALVARTAEEAQRRGVALTAVTFSPRPDVVVSGGGLPDICDLDERVERLRRAGADDVVVVPFTRDLAAVGAAEFVDHLVRDLGAVALCVGSDFALGRGRGRAGTVPALRELGVEVIDVPVVMLPGRPVKISSTFIRRAIATGIPTDLALRGAFPAAA